MKNEKVEVSANPMFDFKKTSIKNQGNQLND